MNTQTNNTPDDLILQVSDLDTLCATYASGQSALHMTCGFSEAKGASERLKVIVHRVNSHDALKAENEALREALHPFAKKWLPEDDMSPEDCIGVAEFDEFMIKRDNIRAARAALALSKDRSGI
jgi:hypothetical protein